MKTVRIILSIIFFGITHNIALAQGIPQVYVVLSENKNIEDIDRNSKIFANMRIENANGSNYAVRELYNGMIRIKGRGNSSWNLPDNDKKSYSIDLVNHLDKKIDIPLLGMPDDADWILYSSCLDKTFLRNYFTYHLANTMGHWASRSRFVELFINDEYRGLYVICENIKRGTNRVNVSPIGNSGIDLTGGYILEQDYPQRLQSEGSQYITSSRIYDGRYYYDIPQTDYFYFGFTYPKDDERTTAQTQYIKNYIADFETALYSSNFADPNEGYRKYIDVNSFVDWFIISELAADYDHYYFLSSCYLTKPQSDKLKIGPVWDFDVGYKTSATNMRVLNNTPWIKRLWEDESFRQLVFDRFVEIIPMIENSLSHIENLATELERRGAIERNFEKWDILGASIWADATPPIPGTYDGEIRRLTQWIRQRYLYIATFENPNYCEVLKRMKPATRIIDQDVFDNGEFPLQVESSSLRIGLVNLPTLYYVWNNVRYESRQYQINNYGKYSLTMRMGTCESLPSDTLYVKRIATVVISENNHVYDGIPKNVNVVTQPPSLPVRITYNGETDPPVTPGKYYVVAEIDDAEYRGKQAEYITISIDEKLIVAPMSKNFGTVVAGYSEITPHTIPLIGNTDLGTVTVELEGTDASNHFEISTTQFPNVVNPEGQIPLTTTVVGGEYRTYLVVRPKLSLPAGTYNATLTFRGDFNPITVNLDFEVSDIGNTLMIWQIGAGNDDSESNVTHSFVELYNAGADAVDLSGYSLQYAEGTRGTANNEGSNDGVWKKMDLSGTIQSKHSFLILGSRISTMPNPALNIEDDYGDINNPSFRLSNRSVKVALMSNTDLLTVQNPFNIDGSGTKVVGYVDMVGAMNDPDHATNADKIRAFETNPAPRITKQTGVRRLNLMDTDDNSVDFETVPYATVTATIKDIKRPKNHAYGAWNPITGIKDGEEPEPITDPVVAGSPDGLANKLLILQAYSSSATANGASHSFVELYNTTNEAINLNGITLYYANGTNHGNGGTPANMDEDWKTIPLSGTIPARTSFLILGPRQNFNTSGNNAPRYLFSENYGDMNNTDFTLSNRAFKVALIRNTKDLTAQNPYTMDGNGIAEGYIDMVGAANTYPTQDMIYGFETAPTRNSASQSARRKNLIDTDKNDTDFENIDYRATGTTDEQLEKYRPKNLAFGAWNPITGLTITSSETPLDLNPLNAWMRSGLLHVTGLTTGKTLSIYNVSGTLVYQSIATSVEADIPLTTQGVYIVCNGERTLKVVY